MIAPWIPVALLAFVSAAFCVVVVGMVRDYRRWRRRFR
jgi:hypothetical protein